MKTFSKLILKNRPREKGFEEPFRLSKPILKNRAADPHESQCFQGFSLFQNGFEEPFEEPRRAFFSPIFQNTPSSLEGGGLKSIMKGQRYTGDRRESPAWRDTP